MVSDAKGEGLKIALKMQLNTMIWACIELSRFAPIVVMGFLG